MPAFEQGDIIKVPFPYSNRHTRQSRPALVVSNGSGNDTLSLLWVVMVTTAESRGWPRDLLLANLSGTGVPAPSLVRTAKIATIEARDAARLGRVEPDVWAEVMARVAERLGVSVRCLESQVRATDRQALKSGVCRNAPLGRPCFAAVSVHLVQRGRPHTLCQPALRPYSP